MGGATRNEQGVNGQRVNGQGVRGMTGFLLAMGGLLVWSSCFVVLYVVLSVGCEAGFGAQRIAGVNALNLVLGLFWAAHMVALVWLILHVRRRQAAQCPAGETRSGASRFVLRTAMLVAVTGLVSTAWTGFPVFLLKPCL